MADNIGYTPGTGSTVAADEIGGALHQRVKVSVGADGSASDWEGAVTVAGGATAAKQDTGNTSVASIDTKTPALGQALAASSVPVVLTAAQVTTLTPPAAITGFATETTLSTLNSKVTAVNTGAVVLAAGSAAIGKLAANSGVDIGDVDVTSVPADPFGLNADAASATGSISAKLRFIASTGIPITGTVTVGSHAVTVASGGVASGAIASGAVASGAVASGAFASGSVADGAIVTLGAKADAKSTATDTTAITAMQVLKQISASVQAPPSQAVTNAGTFAVQVDGAALTSLQLIDDAVFSDDAAFTPGTSKILGIGHQADESSTDSVDEGDIGCPRMTLDRKTIVTTQPHTAGGLSIFRSLDLDETEEDVKTSAGCIYGMWVTNTATTTRWIKFYNATAANTTVGSTTPVITWGIPGNSSDDLGGLTSSANGIAFDTAICVAATTGVADADSGAPGANDVIINIFYK